MFESLTSSSPSIWRPLGRAIISFLGYLIAAALLPVLLGLIIGIPAYGCFWVVIRLIGVAAGGLWVQEHIKKLDSAMIVGGLGTLTFSWFFGLIAAVIGAVQSFRTAQGKELDTSGNAYLLAWIKQKNDPPEDGPMSDLDPKGTDIIE